MCVFVAHEQVFVCVFCVACRYVVLLVVVYPSGNFKLEKTLLCLQKSPGVRLVGGLRSGNTRGAWGQGRGEGLIRSQLKERGGEEEGIEPRKMPQDDFYELPNDKLV